MQELGLTDPHAHQSVSQQTRQQTSQVPQSRHDYQSQHGHNTNNSPNPNPSQLQKLLHVPEGFLQYFTAPERFPNLVTTLYNLVIIHFSHDTILGRHVRLLGARP